MKKRLTMILALIMAVGLVQAGTIEYNFDAGNGMPSANTLDVSAESIVAEAQKDGDLRFQAYYMNGRVELSAHTDPLSTLAFTVNIPAGVTAEFTALDFEYGFAEYYHPSGVNITPTWSLAISTGSGSPTNGALPTVTSQGFTSTNETVVLSGLTGLTGSVTFTLTFDTVEDRSNWQRRHTIDNLVLTGTTSGSPTVAPTILDFIVSSTNPPPGAAITLSWNTSFEDTLTLNPGIGDVTGLTSTQVVVDSDTTYTLTAINGNGTTTELLPLTVITTPPVINSFGADSTNVFAGTLVTLSWNVDDAASISLDQGIGDVTDLSSTQVVVNADTTFTLTAESNNGSTNSLTQITIITTPPVIQSFSASTTTVPVGTSVTLSWTVDDASNLSIDQGVGDVTGLTSIPVEINASATYTLTATSPNGSDIETLEIMASAPPVVFVDFTDSDLSAAGIGNTTTASNLNLSTIGAYWSDISTTTNAGYEGEVTVTDAARDYMTGRHLFIGRLTNQSNGDHVSTATLNFDSPQTLEDTVLSLDAEMDNSGAQPSLGLIVDLYDDTTHVLSINLGTSSTPAPSTRYSIGELNGFGGIVQNLFSSTSGSSVFEANDTGASVSINLGTSTFNVGAISEINGDLGVSETLNYLSSATTFDKVVFTADRSKASWALDNITVTTSGGTPQPVTVSISGPITEGTEMEIFWDSLSGSSYTVQTNSNLTDANGWDDFETVTGTGGEVSVTNTIGPSQTFYKVITE